MKWKYKINLKNKNVFDDIEDKYDIEIPESFKRFIVENNAATPEKYNVMVNNKERVFSGVLSFNENDSDNVFSSLGNFIKMGLLPFGTDPFGNRFCIELPSDKVVFWDHETDKTVSAHTTISSFTNSFY